MDAMLKECPRCNCMKARDCFSSKFESGWCKECHKQYNKEWYQHNKDKHRKYDSKRYNENKEKRKQQATAWKRRKETGCCPEMYNKMFTEQGGSCAICGTHQSELKQQLSVDHCHKTGTIRKLLCNKCNMALGLFQDRLKLVWKAYNYLQDHANG